MQGKPCCFLHGHSVTTATVHWLISILFEFSYAVAAFKSITQKGSPWKRDVRLVFLDFVRLLFLQCYGLQCSYCHGVHIQ